ncbi:MAG: hypothetical protein AB1592_19395 [Pseudomonadota bacterium]
MRSVPLAALSLAALVAAGWAAPVLAQATVQDAPPAAGAPRQPTGALVPDPNAVPARTAPVDGETTSTIRSRDTIGLPQSPENLNVFGCKQIDPLCQGEPRN